MKLHLDRPPINEVVCGFIFDQPVQLSPVLVGAYWAQRRGDFPLHELKDPVFDEVPSVIFSTMAPVRTWLITSDKTRLLQIQNDRFFVNWRKQKDSDAYPRFQSQQDQEPLLPYALREWAQFNEFCKTENLVMSLTDVELSKIDVLIEGHDWNGSADLGKLMPALAPVLGSDPERRDIVWRHSREADGVRIHVTAVSAIHVSSGKPAIRLETRIRKKVLADADLVATFVDLDNRINALFVEMFSESEMKRFGTKWSK